MLLFGGGGGGGGLWLHRHSVILKPAQYWCHDFKWSDGLTDSGLHGYSLASIFLYRSIQYSCLIFALVSSNFCLVVSVCHI